MKPRSIENDTNNNVKKSQQERGLDPDEEQLKIQFSLLPTEDEDMTGLDIIFRAKVESSDAILTSVTQILCAYTDFVITTSQTIDESDICPVLISSQRNETRQHRLKQHEITKISMDVDTAVTSAIKKYSDEFSRNWFELEMAYQVLQIGKNYEVLSDLSLGKKSSLKIVEETAQAAIEAKILDGTANALLSSFDSSIEKFATVRDQEKTFESVFRVEEAYHYQPRLMSPGRITGITMFTSIALFVTFLCSIAKFRMHSRERDFFQREKGGLANEASLMKILDVGRLGPAYSLSKHTFGEEQPSSGLCMT